MSVARVRVWVTRGGRTVCVCMCETGGRCTQSICVHSNKTTILAHWHIIVLLLRMNTIGAKPLAL